MIYEQPTGWTSCFPYMWLSAWMTGPTHYMRTVPYHASRYQRCWLAKLEGRDETLISTLVKAHVTACIRKHKKFDGIRRCIRIERALFEYIEVNQRTENSFDYMLHKVRRYSTTGRKCGLPLKEAGLHLQLKKGDNRWLFAEKNAQRVTTKATHSDFAVCCRTDVCKTLAFQYGLPMFIPIPTNT